MNNEANGRKERRERKRITTKEAARTEWTGPPDPVTRLVNCVLYRMIRQPCSQRLIQRPTKPPATDPPGCLRGEISCLSQFAEWYPTAYDTVQYLIPWQRYNQRSHIVFLSGVAAAPAESNSVFCQPGQRPSIEEYAIFGKLAACRDCLHIIGICSDGRFSVCSNPEHGRAQTN